MSKQNDHQGGSIINIASFAGIYFIIFGISLTLALLFSLTGLVPEPTGPVYSATKSGVVSFTQALRVSKLKDMYVVYLVVPTCSAANC